MYYLPKYTFSLGIFGFHKKIAYITPLSLITFLIFVLYCTLVVVDQSFTFASAFTEYHNKNKYEFVNVQLPRGYAYITSEYLIVFLQLGKFSTDFQKVQEWVFQLISSITILVQQRKS